MAKIASHAVTSERRFSLALDLASRVLRVKHTHEAFHTGAVPLQPSQITKSQIILVKRVKNLKTVDRSTKKTFTVVALTGYRRR